jgi:hypothetical protein
VRRWLRGDETRWRLYAVDLDEFDWYCPDCAEREFGADEINQRLDMKLDGAFGWASCGGAGVLMLLLVRRMLALRDSEEAASCSRRAAFAAGASRSRQAHPPHNP